MTFFEWLRIQRDCANKIGDLARDALKDPDFPWDDALHEIDGYLSEQNACSEAHEALRDAWGQWANGYDPLERKGTVIQFQRRLY